MKLHISTAKASPVKLDTKNNLVFSDKGLPSIVYWVFGDKKVKVNSLLSERTEYAKAYKVIDTARADYGKLFNADFFKALDSLKEAMQEQQKAPKRYHPGMKRRAK